MGLVTHEKILSEKEYISLELQSDNRHEYVNGKLIDMSGESDLHNQLAVNCCIILKMLLKNKGYSFFVEGVKVKLPDENKYYYPDVFISREPLSNGTIYIKENPELIIAVLSDSTRKYDTVDKFINYQRFNSWNLDTYSKSTDVINLPKLGICITVHELYAL